MHHKKLSAISFIGSLSSFFVLLAFVGTASVDAAEPLTVPGEVIFKVKAGSSGEEIINQETGPDFSVSKGKKTGLSTLDISLENGGVETVKPVVPHLRKKESKNAVIEDPQGLLYVASLKNKNKKSVDDFIGELDQDPSIEYAEPNFIYSPVFVPDDPYFGSVGSWGQEYRDLWGLERLQTEQAWDVTQGSGVLVAVIDTGIQFNHPDLADNVFQNPGETGDGRETNGIDDDGNGLIDDWRGYDFESRDNPPDNDATDFFGHGSHVSGTIAAVANNGIGMAGIAPQAKILPVKVFQDGSNPTATTIDIAVGVRYAADMGARVTNNSYGGSGSSQTVTDAFNYAMSRGVVNVAAAGNSALDASGFNPANIPGVIAVAASTYTDRRADFSNFGNKVDVAAPGAGDGNSAPDSPSSGANNILSTMGSNMFIATGNPSLKVSEDSGFAYVRIRGTSMASPHVAGVAALAVAAFPNESQAEIRGRLRATASPFAIAPEPGRPIGTGVVSAYRAVTEQAHPALSIRNFRIISTSDGDLFPESDEIINVALEAENSWLSAGNVTLTLSTAHPGIVGIPTATVSLGGLAAGESKDNATDPFVVQLGTVDSATIIDFTLQTDADGYVETFNLPLTFGVPVFTQLHNIHTFTFHNTTFVVNAVDPNGLALTYQALSLPPGASFNSSTRRFTWSPSLATGLGVWDVTFTATNTTGNTGTMMMRITVEPNNDPHFITTQTQYDAVRNRLFTAQFRAEDPDVLIDHNGNSIPDFVRMRLRTEITHPNWLTCTQAGSGVLNCSGTPKKNGTFTGTILGDDDYYGGTVVYPELVITIRVRNN